MEGINLYELPQELFAKDLELKKFLESLTDSKALHAYNQVLNFELFISQLPDEITLDEYKKHLTKTTIEIRFLTAKKLTDFYTRISNSKKELPIYKTFKEFLYIELIQHSSEKLTWQ